MSPRVCFFHIAKVSLKLKIYMSTLGQRSAYFDRSDMVITLINTFCFLFLLKFLRFLKHEIMCVNNDIFTQRAHDVARTSKSS